MPTFTASRTVTSTPGRPASRPRRRGTGFATAVDVTLASLLLACAACAATATPQVNLKAPPRGNPAGVTAPAPAPGAAQHSSRATTTP